MPVQGPGARAPLTGPRRGRASPEVAENRSSRSRCAPPSARTSRAGYLTLTVWEVAERRWGDGPRTARRQGERPRMGDVTRGGGDEKGPSLLEDARERGRHPQRGAYHGHRQDTPGEALREHRHRQAEIYLVLQGTGVVRVGGEARPVGAGSAVFIPGNAPHSCENTGAPDLRFAYVFPASSFEEVEYVFTG